MIGILERMNGISKGVTKKIESLQFKLFKKKDRKRKRLKKIMI